MGTRQMTHEKEYDQDLTVYVADVGLNVSGHVTHHVTIGIGILHIVLTASKEREICLCREDLETSCRWRPVLWDVILMSQALVQSLHVPTPLAHFELVRELV